MRDHFYEGNLSINLILNNKKNPTTCIIGGSKITTKLGVIKSLIKKLTT